MTTSQNSLESNTARYQRTLIIAQCLGLPAYQVTLDGALLVVYFTMLGAKASVILGAMGFAGFLGVILALVFAGFAVSVGKRRMVVTLMTTGAVLFITMGSAGFLPISDATLITVVACLVVLYGMVNAVGSPVWFAFMKDLVPQGELPLFLGRIRATWTAVNIAVFSVIGWIVGVNPSRTVIQIILITLGVSALGRSVALMTLPESPRGPRERFRDFIKLLPNERDLIGFCVYVFILYSMVGCFLPTLYLFAQKSLHVSSKSILFLTVVSTIAQVAGYLIAGPMMSRVHTKTIYLICHGGFGIISLGVVICVANELPQAVLTILLCVAAGGFSFLSCVAAVAMSVDVFRLAVGKFQSASLALSTGVLVGGSSLSRIVVGRGLDSGIFSPQWTWGERTFTIYHTVFLFVGLGVVFASVLLLLLPVRAHAREPAKEPTTGAA